MKLHGWTLEDIVINASRCLVLAICFVSIIALILSTLSNAADIAQAPTFSERNYYADEVQIENHCLPLHMGRWNDSGTPESGWFPLLEKCANNSVLKTIYGAPIENATIYTNESNGRINGLLTPSGFKSIPSVKAWDFSQNDANTYAKRITDTMINIMEGVVLIQRKDNCIHLMASELNFSTKNAIQSIHWLFPYVRVQKVQDGWCFIEP